MVENLLTCVSTKHCIITRRKGNILHFFHTMRQKAQIVIRWILIKGLDAVLWSNMQFVES